MSSGRVRRLLRGAPALVLVLILACSSGGGESRLVLPSDVSIDDLVSALPIEALPEGFSEQDRRSIPLGSPEGIQEPPNLQITFADRDALVVLIIAVEAAGARLDRHTRQYETTPLAVVTRDPPSRGLGEDCDPSADSSDRLACAWKSISNPKIGEDSAAYESAKSDSDRTSRVYLFVDSGVFASLVVSYVESPPGEEVERALLEALEAGVQALVERKSVPD